MMIKQKRKSFKRVPKKYHPEGLTVLFEDQDILVVEKTSGLLTVGSEKIRENTAYYLLTGYVRKGNSKSKKRLFIVHRLDRDTSGVIVFAKNEESKRFLQKEWHGFEKKYYAVIHGTLSEKEGIITSYLAENSFHKVYSVSGSAKGKLAKTGYKIIKESPDYSLLEIDLLTGRKNQIRVHLADKNCPVVGDKKYGRKEKGIKRLALHAASIKLTHPWSKETMTFHTDIPRFFNSLI